MKGGMGRSFGQAAEGPRPFQDRIRQVMAPFQPIANGIGEAIRAALQQRQGGQVQGAQPPVSQHRTQGRQPHEAMMNAATYDKAAADPIIAAMSRRGG